MSFPGAFPYLNRKEISDATDQLHKISPTDLEIILFPLPKIYEDNQDQPRVTP